MSEAARDNNQVIARLGSSNGTPIGLKVDHATGYLKIKLLRKTLSAPTFAPTAAIKDENEVSSALASYNSLPKALLAEHTSGYIRISPQ